MMTLILLLAQVAPPDARFWDDHSVVYCQVTKIAGDPMIPHGELRLTLATRATISGKFDPGLEPEITALAAVSGRLPVVRSGNMIVALLQVQRSLDPADPRPKYTLENNPVSFFPQRDVVNGLDIRGKGNPPIIKDFVVGCVVVKSFDDPAVDAIRDGIKKVRK